MRIRRADLAVAGIAITGVIITGTACGSAAVTWVTPSDPVISICQQPSIASLSSLVTSVDNANNTDLSGVNSRGQALTSSQHDDLVQAARQLTTLATQAAGHPGFQQSLLNEAAEFQTAAAGAGGLTTNAVAIAADAYGGQILAACSSFRIGTAPKAAKPGPAVWDWPLFWIALCGYTLMIFAGSILLGFSEREKERKLRLSSGEIFWYSLIWPTMLMIIGARIWRQVLERVKTTPDEKKNDRLAVLTARNRVLEDQLGMKDDDDDKDRR